MVNIPEGRSPRRLGGLRAPALGSEHAAQRACVPGVLRESALRSLRRAERRARVHRRGHAPRHLSHGEQHVRARAARGPHLRADRRPAGGHELRPAALLRPRHGPRHHLDRHRLLSVARPGYGHGRDQGARREQAREPHDRRAGRGCASRVARQRVHDHAALSRHGGESVFHRHEHHAAAGELRPRVHGQGPEGSPASSCSASCSMRR